MKKSILVLYYSQSGQLGDILSNLTADIKAQADIDIVKFEPEQDFPFPWKSDHFFDAMPECVARVPSPIKPIPQAVLDKEYDLVILGYQPWFLSPSQPTTSFLKSQYASLLNGRPVVTVIGCRNMWLNGQECVKEDIQNAGGKLVGNIVLMDTHPNLVALFTIIRWAFKGQKEASGILPEAGVSTHDINNATRFGQPILAHLNNNQLDTLQNTLLDKGAITMKPGLIILERRGITNFRKFATYIREKGGPGDSNRKSRVKLFQRLLMLGIFVLSPISNLTAFIQLQLQKRSLVKDVDYYKGVNYEAGRL